MAKYSNRVEQLERELGMKQLQFNRLLDITQAINGNLSADELYTMYQNFLELELGIKKMALFIKNPDIWSCVTQIGIDTRASGMNLAEKLSRYKRTESIREINHPFLAAFEIVVPVFHKSEPIAYVFMGGFVEGDDIFAKVQLVTTITNIIAVATENKRLFKKQLEQERFARESELAREMQRMLIPRKLPQTGTYELAGFYQPHFEVGGDYYDFMDFGDGKIGFCIADISGKGMAAALLMANFQANLHGLIHKRYMPDVFMQELNTSVNRITQGERYITFFFAEFDDRTNRMYYINAGHVTPIVVNKKTKTVTSLNKGCTILGCFPRLPELEIGYIYIEEESLVLLYTDGLTDVHNAKKEYLDEDILQSFCQHNCHLSATKFNQVLNGFVNEFKGDIPYPDDITVFTCKIYPEK
jgi:phosphoserine phosphatase RsbU/P